MLLFQNLPRIRPCRVVLRNRQIENYLAIRNLRIHIERLPNNNQNIDVVLPRGLRRNVNDIVNPRLDPPTATTTETETCSSTSLS